MIEAKVREPKLVSLSTDPDRLKNEIEAFDDFGAFEELMARPYTRRIKKEVDEYMSSIELRGATILELGCGISEHAHRFNQNNTMILTDINWNLLQKNPPPSILVLCDAQNLEQFDDGSIDFLIYVGILHHLQDQRLALREAARVLKPGGRIFICEPNKKSLNFVYYHLRRMSMRLIGKQVLKKMIGCFTPDEEQLDIATINEVFDAHYEVNSWTILSFRLPPFRIFKNSKIDVLISNILDRLPPFRSIGTTILYEIKSRRGSFSRTRESSEVISVEPSALSERILQP